MCESQHETRGADNQDRRGQNPFLAAARTWAERFVATNAIGAERPPNSMDEANRLVEHVQSHVRCLLASGDPVTPSDVEQAVISAIMPTYPAVRDVFVTAMRDATGEVTGWAAEATVTMGSRDVMIRPVVRAAETDPGSIPAAVRRDGDGEANTLVQFGADFMQLRPGHALVVAPSYSGARLTLAFIRRELERRGERGPVWRQDQLELDPVTPGGPRPVMRAVAIGAGFPPVRALKMVLFDGVMAELDAASRQWLEERVFGRAVPSTRLIDRTGDVTADWSGRTPPITGGSGLTGGALVGVDWGAAKSHSCVATYDGAGGLKSVEFDPAASDGFDGIRRHFAELSPSTLDVDALKGGPLTRESYLADVAAYKGRQMRQRLVAPPQPPSDMVPQSMAPIDPLPIRPMSPERFAELKRAFEDAWEVAPVRRPLMVLSPPLTNLEAIGNGANEGELLAAWFALSEVDEHERREASRRRGLALATNLGAKPYPTAAEAIARVVDGQTETVAARELPEMYARLRAGLMVGGLTGGGFVPYEDGAHDDMDGGVPIRVRFDRERAERRRAFALARFARLELADFIDFVASPKDA